MTSSLEQLRSFTTVVADTGDFEAMRAFAPQDATTNPSLILRAVQLDRYQSLLDETLARHRHRSTAEQLEHLLVRFGCEILAIVPGRVSTEVDARLSYDTAATIAQARRLIALYEDAGIERERVLIKIAATWEGIQAARQLEAEGIHCNLTLLFSIVQAAACAEAGVRLISPFVGRILDWHKARTGREYAASEDPGVQSVRAIYTYLKGHGFATEIMGASFRSTGQILALAGCDLLTIAPELLAQLQSMQTPVLRQLSPPNPGEAIPERIATDHASFRTALAADLMASEKLSAGVSAFASDIEKLETLIQSHPKP